MIACVSSIRDQHGLVLLRDARLRLTGEVDEVAEHREHVLVLGELRAQRERGRGHDRAERVVHGHDLAARDCRPFALMSSMNASYTLYSSTRVVWMYGSMHLKSTSATPILIVVVGHARAERLRDRRAGDSRRAARAGVVVVSDAVFVPLPHAASTSTTASDQRDHRNRRDEPLAFTSAPSRRLARHSANVRVASGLVHGARVGRAAARSVRRRSAPPSRGHGASSVARHVAGVRSAAPAERRAASCGSPGAARAARRRRSRPRRARDRSPARHSASSTSRLPRPAIRAWSINTALTGAVRVPSAWSSCLQRERERVGTEPRLVGIELDRAEPARVAQHERAAVGEVHAEAMPLRDPAVARVHERVAGLLAVDDHAAAHAEVHAEPHVGIRRCRARSACRSGARAVNELPISACRSAAAVVPRLRNHVSGACTRAISRSSACASSTSRAASTSRISGTERARRS